MELALETGSVISRPLKDFKLARHVGVVINHMVLELSKENGIRLVTIEEFAQGMDISFEGRWSRKTAREIFAEAEKYKKVNYNLLFFNCESFVRGCHGKFPVSFQSLIGLTLAAGMSYFAVKKMRA